MPRLKAKKKAKQRPPRHASRKPESRAIALRVPGLSRQAWELNDEQVTLIKNTVAKGATDDELQLFLTTARRHRLDPFTHQIWLVRRYDRRADSGKRDAKGDAILGAYVGVTQVGIDGLTHLAARDHRDFGSISLPEYGPMVNGHPEWARVTVYKKGIAQPTVAEAWWEEYAPAEMDKAPFWRKMPRRMLAKCATALALRQAYPDLSGVYIPEEMAKMQEDFTPSGRQIVSPTAPVIETRKLELLPESEDPAVKEYERRVALQKETAAKQKPTQDPKPNLLVVRVDAHTYSILGRENLLASDRELLRNFWNETAKQVVVTDEQLDGLKFEYEKRGIPILPLKENNASRT